MQGCGRHGSTRPQTKAFLGPGKTTTSTNWLETSHIRRSTQRTPFAGILYPRLPPLAAQQTSLRVQRFDIAGATTPGGKEKVMRSATTQKRTREGASPAASILVCVAVILLAFSRLRFLRMIFLIVSHCSRLNSRSPRSQKVTSVGETSSARANSSFLPRGASRFAAFLWCTLCCGCLAAFCAFVGPWTTFSRRRTRLVF